ncbi:hypothetical protein [Polaromonas sp. DSR2-3-2]|uniref:hypothetical protein n=1 Tax=unclassified Polaromonas TaxID=2638319 RepID=UPI003CF80DBA
MPIFKISGAKLNELNSLPLDKEKNLQALVEANLIEVLDLTARGKRIFRAQQQAHASVCATGCGTNRVTARH